MKPKKIELSDEVTRTIAARSAAGVSRRDLEKEFGISRFVINRILASDVAKDAIRDVITDQIAMEIAQSRRDFAELLPLAIGVVRDKLEKGELKAAEMVLRVNALLVPEPKADNKQAQTLTVILPGQSAAKEIPCESSTNEA